ncbi:unnamed protein product [Phytophthora fragariaefolia]|uniref:Unnamed protein product n=1 Tax=Phytophthora fragariaefolia TaxID=1490495 RepID=A0A9W6XHK7_9STRA|nr:unnamed protein product [Phytophthora fragariaefolia]
MGKTEWLVDSGPILHVTSVRDKFVSMKKLKTPVRITIADGWKIDTVAMGIVGLKLMDRTSVKLSDALYILEVDGNLISVAKPAEKDVAGQFSKDKCVFRYGNATVMEAKRCGNVYKLKAVGDEVCLLTKFKIYKAAMENVTGKAIKRLRSDNGGEHTDKLFKAYLNHNGIKHEKPVPYTPQQNGLAERMNRTLVEMARCILYREGIDKK